ncbi:MAG: FxsA family protein [Thermoanaerobaculia bacterium]
MLGRLLLLFILVPVAELALLIEIGQRVGLPATLALIVATGMLGAFLARQQGLGVLARIRSETDQGRLPADQLIDGALILVAGAVLMTPGVLTDALGFFCLIPPGRKLLNDYLTGRIQRAVERGTVRMSADFSGGLGGPYRRETRDVTPRSSKPKLERLPADDDPEPT